MLSAAKYPGGASLKTKSPSPRSFASLRMTSGAFSAGLLLTEASPVQLGTVTDRDVMLSAAKHPGGG